MENQQYTKRQRTLLNQLFLHGLSLHFINLSIKSERIIVYKFNEEKICFLPQFFVGNNYFGYLILKSTLSLRIPLS